MGSYFDVVDTIFDQAGDLCLENMGGDDSWLSGLFIDFLLAKFSEKYKNVYVFAILVTVCFVFVFDKIPRLQIIYLTDDISLFLLIGIIYQLLLLLSI